MRNLRITLLQSDIVWEDPTANLAMFDEKINEINEKTDLIILPEMFTTGFSMAPENLAQTMGGTSVQWLLKKSDEAKSDITGSLIIEENGRYFNRLVWVKPDKTIITYNKKHLFCLTHESEKYNAGKKNIIVNLNGWKIRPFICYDLRFPVWTRNLYTDNGPEYDLSIYIANWPETRAAHWNLLLKARAVENQAYVAGVNRVGIDGNGIHHSGDSTIIGPFGDIIYTKKNKEDIITIELSYQDLLKAREAFPFLKDGDLFDLR